MVPQRASALVACSAALWGLLASPPAAATPNVGSQISRGLFQLLSKTLPQHLNGKHPLTDLSGSAGCAEVKGKNLDFDLDIKSLDVLPGDNRLDVSLVVSGRSQGDVKVEGCVLLDSDCGAKIAIGDTHAALTVVPVIDNGVVKLNVIDLRVRLDPDRVDVEFSDCSLGSVLNGVVKLTEDFMVQKAREIIEDMIRTKLIPELEQTLSGFTKFSSQASDANINATVTSLTTRTAGLDIAAVVAISAAKRAPCTSAAGDPAAVKAQQPSPRSSVDHLNLSVALPVVQQALWALWRSGKLCFAADGEMGFDIIASAPRAPEVSLLPGRGARVMVRLPGLTAKFGGEASFSAELDITVVLNLEIDKTRSIVFAAPEVTLERMDVTKDPSVTLDVEEILRRLVPPLIEQQIEDNVVVPRTLSQDAGQFGSYYLYLTYSETTKDHIYLAAHLHAKAGEDTQPPSTQMRTQLPARIRPQRLPFVASGSDNSTPSPLLRYRWRVNDGAWSEPTFSARHSLQLTEGRYAVQVAAVDLHGNTDPKPVAVTFDVDKNAPAFARQSYESGGAYGSYGSDGYTYTAVPGEQEGSAQSDEDTGGMVGSGCDFADGAGAGGQRVAWVLLVSLAALVVGRWGHRRRRSGRA